MDSQPDFFILEIDLSGRILNVLQQQGSFDKIFLKAKTSSN